MENVATSNGNIVLKNNVKIAIIGFGQAGAKMTIEIAKKTNTPAERCIVINTSEADLRSIPWFLESNRIMITPDGKGAGKQRDVVLGMIQQTNADIISKVASILGVDYDILLTCYSADGGTGSGSGPIMSALFSTDVLDKKGGVPVIGICALPDHTVGILGLQNALNNIKESANFLKGNRMITMFVDNDAYSAESKDSSLRYAKCNEDVATLLDRYINVSYVSSSSNLDFADRNVMLNTPGMQALVKFDPVSGKPASPSPFVLPEGAVVSKQAVEMPEGHGETVAKLNNIVGCTVNESSFAGYYSEGAADATPICHYAGFVNLDKLAERYQSWISQIQQKSEAQRKVDRERGRGLADLARNAEYIKEESSVKTEGGFDDLFAIMNK